jgi:hypothetical protein
MAGIPFLSKILALAGINVKEQSTGKEVLINVSPSQPSTSTVTVDLPEQSGQLAIKSEVVLQTEKAAANGVATLDGSGKIPTAQLPALAVSEVFVVSSESAMLALSAQVGDIAIRTDINESFILGAEPASTLSNWIEFRETSGVTQVNGQTGDVTLGAADVGAVALTGDTMTGILTMDPHGTASGETGTIRLKELAVNGAYFVGLRSPDELTDNVILTMPDSAGSGGQYLKTDGTGILSWGTINFPVTQVNGYTGIVTLNAADVGAVSLTGDTMTGALVMAPVGTLPGQGGIISFRELAANGSDSVSLKAPDSLAGSVTFTLPATDGSANQALITNGSGVLSWSDFPAVPVQSVNGKTGIVVLNTDDVGEGSLNLYFTELRAKSAAVVDSMAGSQTDQAPSVSSVKSYIASNSPVLSVNGETGIVSLDSDDIGEGSLNLYFTELRAKSAAVVDSMAGSQTDQAPSVSSVKSYIASDSPVLSVNGLTGIVSLTTSAISEGSNLYFTDERAKTAAVVNSTTGSQTDQAPSVSAIKSYIASSSPVLSVNGLTGSVSLTTTNISEGVNLYFTDARARSAAVLDNTSGSQTDQAPSISAMKAYVAASAPVLSVNGYSGVVSLSASDVGAVAKTGDTMTGALTMAPTGTLSGQTGVIRFSELAANGSDTVSLRAPDSLSSSITLVLPNSVGSGGQVLATNGAGETSWVDVTDVALSARVDKLEASRGVYTGSLSTAQALDISSLVGAGAIEHPIIQVYKVDGGVHQQVNVEFSFDPVTKTVTFGTVVDGPISAVIHVLALTSPLTTL